MTCQNFRDRPKVVHSKHCSCLAFFFIFLLRRLAITDLRAPTRFIILCFVVILIFCPVQLRRIISVRIFGITLNPSTLGSAPKRSIVVFYLKTKRQKKKNYNVPSLHRETSEEIKHFFFRRFGKNLTFYPPRQRNEQIKLLSFERKGENFEPTSKTIILLNYSW